MCFITNEYWKLRWKIHFSQNFTFAKCSAISSKDFWILPHFLSLYSVGMATSKYPLIFFFFKCSAVQVQCEGRSFTQADYYWWILMVIVIYWWPVLLQEVSEVISQQKSLMKSVLDDTKLNRLRLEGGTFLARIRKEEMCENENYRYSTRTVQPSSEDGQMLNFISVGY